MYSVKKIVQMIKSITAREVFKRCPEVKKQLWGGEFWTDGYYASTVSKHGDEARIAKYVKNQEQEYIKLYEDSVFVSEEFFLIAVSELLNKKLHTKEFEDANDKVDFKTLHEIIENLELIQQNNNFILTPYKKARAVVMLYRSFKTSGKIDQKMIEDIVAISGEYSDNSKNTL